MICSPGNPWFSQIFSTDPAGFPPEDVHRRLVHPLGAHWDGPLPDLLLPGAEKTNRRAGSPMRQEMSRTLMVLLDVNGE